MKFEFFVLPVILPMPCRGGYQPPEADGIERFVEWCQFPTTALGFPGGVAERSEFFKIMIAGGNHTKIKKLSDGTSEPAD